MLVGKWTQSVAATAGHWCSSGTWRQQPLHRLAQSLLSRTKVLIGRQGVPHIFLTPHPSQVLFSPLIPSSYSLATANAFSTSILPQSWMTTSLRGLSRPSVLVFSIFFTTSWRTQIKGIKICLKPKWVTNLHAVSKHSSHKLQFANTNVDKQHRIHVY